MPAERLPPDDPREWLNRARSNLARAKVQLPEVYLEDLCFDAQQAAEKAIKAFLLHRAIPFPHTHDLGELLRLLEQSGETIPPRITEAKQLTDYAVEARYPGLSEPLTRQEYEDAIRLAEDVVRWVQARL